MIVASAIAVVLGIIGFGLAKDGKNPVAEILGVLVLLIAGAVLAIGVGIPEATGWIKPDHEKCQSYQWLDESWKCVPKEQAG